jgi:hypothetical protein
VKYQLVNGVWRLPQTPTVIDLAMKAVAEDYKQRWMWLNFVERCCDD